MICPVISLKLCSYRNKKNQTKNETKQKRKKQICRVLLFYEFQRIIRWVYQCFSSKYSHTVLWGWDSHLRSVACAGRQSEQAYDSDEHLDEQQNVSLSENALCRLRQFS